MRSENDTQELEIKIILDAHEFQFCKYWKCNEPAEKDYEVGKMDRSGGVSIPLCHDHCDDEIAFKVYREWGY